MENNELNNIESFGDMPIDYLMHHGIKGQKWGVRRYQNKDGSLTAAGRKRYEKLESELNKLGGKPDGKDTARAKKPKDMTDDELRSAIGRFRLEDEYNNYYNRLNPAKVSKGKKHMETLMSSAVSGISEGAKTLIRDALVKKGKEALGLNDLDPDGMDALKKTAEKMKLKSQIATSESILAKRAKEKAAEEKEAAEAKAAKDREAAESYKNSPEYKRYNDPENWNSNEGSYRYRYSNNTSNDTTRVRAEDVEIIEPKWSSKTSAEQAKTIMLGQTYVAGYLEDPNR